MDTLPSKQHRSKTREKRRSAGCENYRRFSKSQKNGSILSWSCVFHLVPLRDCLRIETVSGKICNQFSQKGRVQKSVGLWLCCRLTNSKKSCFRTVYPYLNSEYRDDPYLDLVPVPFVFSISPTWGAGEPAPGFLVEINNEAISVGSVGSVGSVVSVGWTVFRLKRLQR